MVAETAQQAGRAAEESLMAWLPHQARPWLTHTRFASSPAATWAAVGVGYGAMAHAGLTAHTGSPSHFLPSAVRLPLLLLSLVPLLLLTVQSSLSPGQSGRG